MAMKKLLNFWISQFRFCIIFILHVTLKHYLTQTLVIRKVGVTRAIVSSRRQRNRSNFIALLARVIKMRVFHVLRGNAIVT